MLGFPTGKVPPVRSTANRDEDFQRGHSRTDNILLLLLLLPPRADPSTYIHHALSSPSVLCCVFNTTIYPRQPPRTKSTPTAPKQKKGGCL